ncbi:S26 family signal peptidase [Streptomyces sp. NPDC058401]|uniref:S26 family signal peptidase n=1 Tax=Streptomyces sp. NPDC058401 TaxID=3346480 RepID=UPI00364D24BF
MNPDGTGPLDDEVPGGPTGPLDDLVPGGPSGPLAEDPEVRGRRIRRARRRGAAGCAALGAGALALLATRGAGAAVLLAAPAALAALALAVSALLGRLLVVVRVRGASMEPTYRDGDRVLVRRRGPIGVGAIVVMEQPGRHMTWTGAPVTGTAGAAEIAHREWLIKRVAAVPGDPVPRAGIPALAGAVEERVPRGRLVLLGDNPRVSVDSRRVGYFPAGRILGTVLRTLPR